MRFLQSAIDSSQPLLMKPERAQALCRAAADKGFTDQLAYFFGDRPKPYRVGKVGVVPLVGAIGKGLSNYDKATGGADVDEFRAELAKMAARPDVETVLIHVNSPGGTVVGVREAADAVYNLGKPTVTFSDDLMASAGYFIGSQADRVVVTPSSAIGSIGVYQVLYEVDTTRDGFKVEALKSGDLKGAGIYGVPITPEQKAYLQANIEEMGADFRSTVLRKRSLVSMDDMRGQDFTGRTAAAKGLATGLANGLDDLIAELNA